MRSVQLNESYIAGQQAFVDNALATSNADYNLVIVSARASTLQRMRPFLGSVESEEVPNLRALMAALCAKSLRGRCYRAHDSVSMCLCRGTILSTAEFPEARLESK